MASPPSASSPAPCPWALRLTSPTPLWRLTLAWRTWHEGGAGVRRPAATPGADAAAGRCAVCCFLRQPLLEEDLARRQRRVELPRNCLAACSPSASNGDGASPAILCHASMPTVEARGRAAGGELSVVRVAVRWVRWPCGVRCCHLASFASQFAASVDRFVLSLNTLRFSGCRHTVHSRLLETDLQELASQRAEFFTAN